MISQVGKPTLALGEKERELKGRTREFFHLTSIYSMWRQSLSLIVGLFLFFGKIAQPDKGREK